MTTPQPAMVLSDFNLEKLDTIQLQKHIRCSIQAASNVAMFGRRGLGKTQICKQIIRESGLVEVYMNLSVYERVDLGGYPDMLTPQEKGERFIKYILPKMYEQMIVGDQKVVALLDEVDKADQSLWAPLLEFVNLKSINGRLLPNLQSVLMTGNLISEGGARPSLPLLDRTEKYFVEATVAAWLEWAAMSGEIHPSIYQFIMDHPTCLQGPVDSADHYADESPRGWTLASKVLFFGEEHNWPVDVLNEKVSGYVGKKAGMDYKMYYVSYKVLLPLVNKVFAGEDYSKEWLTLTPTEKLYTAVIVCSRFATALDAANVNAPPECIKFVGKFMQRAGYENVLISVRQQLLVKRIVRWTLDEHPDWEGVLGKINNSVNS